MKNYIQRFTGTFIEERKTSKQIILITGARQTGKTTLVKKLFPKLPYINLDSIEERLRLASVPAARWHIDIGTVILDEVQKEPAAFEKIKYAYDAHELDFSVLLGSSQILLLKKIHESLAGRISIFELYPFLFAELTQVESTLKPPLLEVLLSSPSLDSILSEAKSVLPVEQQLHNQQMQKYLLTYGGMPKLLHLPESERIYWLRDYELTYLERDLSDLARLSDLEPFRTFQKLAALRTGCLLNYSELARDAGISVDTARRYLEYLKLSYQVALLQPYNRNLTSSVIKTPKLYWIDIGICRVLTGFMGETTGALFETMVVSEIIKWIKTKRSGTEYYFYRTRNGLELDLLLKTQHGMIGIEIKSRNSFSHRDTTVLQAVAVKLGHEWLGGLVVYNGNRLVKICEPNIWAVPSWRLLSNYQ